MSRESEEMALETPTIPLDSILTLSSAPLSRGSFLYNADRRASDLQFSNLNQLSTSYILIFY